MSVLKDEPDGSKPLANPRHERFCQEYAGACFGFATAAYAKAGYRPKSAAAASADASRLIRKGNVSARIRHLRDAAADLLGVDRLRILQLRLQIAYSADTAPSDVLAALRDIERSLGLAMPSRMDVTSGGKAIPRVTEIRFVS